MTETDLALYTDSQLAAFHTACCAESGRLMGICDGITARQAALGCAPPEQDLWYKLRADWKIVWAASTEQVEMAKQVSAELTARWLGEHAGA